MLYYRKLQVDVFYFQYSRFTFSAKLIKKKLQNLGSYNYIGANIECTARGGHVTSVHSHAEMNFINSNSIIFLCYSSHVTRGQVPLFLFQNTLKGIVHSKI